MARRRNQGEIDRLSCISHKCLLFSASNYRRRNVVSGWEIVDEGLHLLLIKLQAHCKVENLHEYWVIETSGFISRLRLPVGSCRYVDWILINLYCNFVRPLRGA